MHRWAVQRRPCAGRWLPRAGLLAAACAGVVSCSNPADRQLELLSESVARLASGFVTFSTPARNAWTPELALNGLEPNGRYRVALNGRPGDQAMHDLLAACPLDGRLTSGYFISPGSGDREGYCDVAIVETDASGAARRVLRLALPPGTYAVKLFIKRDAGAYDVVLKHDDVRFEVAEVGAGSAYLLAGVLASGALLGFVWWWRRRQLPPPILPPAPQPPPLPVTRWTFRQKHDTGDWEVGRARLFELPAVDGFAYIHALLERPRQEIPAVLLYWMQHPPPGVPMDAAGLSLRKEADGVRRPVDYRREIERHLDRAQIEKARQTVTHRVRTALEVIRKVDSEMAEYFDKTIQPGKNLLYVDNGTPPVSWQLD